MACCEPQFLQFNDSTEGIQFVKHKSETGDSISPIEDHVQIQKDNAEQAEDEPETAEEDLEFDDYVDSSEIEFDPDIKRVRFFANEAIKWYNRRKGAKYKLKRVLRATASFVAGFTYEITFTAEECKSGHKRYERAVKFFACNREGDEKVFYDSGDDKPSTNYLRPQCTGSFLISQ